VTAMYLTRGVQDDDVAFGGMGDEKDEGGKD
jgi:hypothetical protein